MAERAVHLGVNIYCWDLDQQNRALTAAVRPLVNDLVEHLSPCHVWFDRHDARGPHAMVMWTVPGHAADRVEQRLSESLRQHFDHQSRPSPLPLEEIEARHVAASRQPLCEVDRQEGLAQPNTFALFRQPTEGFPYVLTRHLPDDLATAFWQQATELTRWCLDALERQPAKPLTGLALLWLAAFDHALSRSMPGMEAEFWSYFAFSLWPGLRQGLEEERQETLQTIHRSIGERNRAVFKKIWQDPKSSWSFDGLMVIFEQTHNSENPHSWRLARTLVHCTLKQLGMDQQQESPAVFYGLHRALSASTGGHDGS